MEYEVIWDERVIQDWRRITGSRAPIINKINNIAKTIPESLKLRGVQPIRGAPDGFYEVDVAKNRVAIFVDNDKRFVTVLFLGAHDVFHEYLRQSGY